MATPHSSNKSVIKLCVIGETVGKSCFINRFVNKSFAARHIKHNHIEQLYHKQVNIADKTYDIQIIDTTNTIHDDTDNNYNNKSIHDILHIQLKDIDNYSMDIRKSWIIDNDILFLLFNRLNRISWLIIQNIHSLTIKYLSKNIENIPIYIISTCCDLYQSSNLQSIDSVVCSIYFHLCL